MGDVNISNPSLAVCQVFLEGTPRGLRAAKVLLPGAAACWSDTFSPSPTAVGANLTNPTLSTSPGSTPPDESGSSVRRRFSIGGADEMYGPGGGGVLVGVGGNIRQGQRRSVSFGASSDDSSSGSGGGASGAVVSWTGPGGGEGGAATPWPLSVVATVGSVGWVLSWHVECFVQSHCCAMACRSSYLLFLVCCVPGKSQCRFSGQGSSESIVAL